MKSGGRCRWVVAALFVTGCSVHSTAVSDDTHEPSAERQQPRASAGLEARELYTRYQAALAEFNRGHYEIAALQFAELVLRAPGDESGDELRHLLVQHVAWSLLGSYDLSGDPEVLDRGEGLLERYLSKHEQLFPSGDGEREVIYELLGEYTMRREGEPPTDASDQLVELVGDTASSLAGRPVRARGSGVDRKVRNIEVDTRGFARLDDPRVQRQLRSGPLGPSLMDMQGMMLHPTRVLVRGFVRHGKRSEGAPAGSRAYALVRAARLDLERCYAAALGRGADIVERLELELGWDARNLSEVRVDDRLGLDDQATYCISTALQLADGESTARAGRAEARLQLTFFVQSARYLVPRGLNLDAGPVPRQVPTIVGGFLNFPAWGFPDTIDVEQR